jgi:raffinose/stachyose/melibiose transport system permease protein
LPGFIVFLTFILYPAILTFNYSLTEWDGYGQKTYVGLGNYVQVLTTDPLVWRALKNNFAYIVFYSAAPMVSGLVLASLIYRSRIRGLTVLRAGLFLPQIMPVVVIGIIWRWLLSPLQGPANLLLDALGLESLARPWLGDFATALPTVGLIGTWIWTGFCMVIFLAGLQKIDPALFEAAQIDGAGPVAEFFAITVPSLRYEAVVTFFYTVIIALHVFGLVYVSTEGGPGEATLPIALYTYRNVFTYHRVGYGSAIAIVTSILVLSVAVALVVAQERRLAD